MSFPTLWILLILICLCASRHQLHRFRAFKSLCPSLHFSPPLSWPSSSSSRLYAHARTTVEDFFNDEKIADLGPVRFVVMGSGAIMESTSTFTNPCVSSTATGGRLITFSPTNKSGEQNNFELHVKLDEMKDVSFVETIKFDQQLLILRFLNGEGKSLLSAIMQDKSKSALFYELKEKYQGKFT